ncbi:hypothetical protein ACFFJY_03155 [Fictibacillus aquaticus]|uniref:Uncharacterized protein n=1 Tax=Fictibacillus aquaticus TaxID=2021314 RepID=A0A235FAC8_9BACL|nr:hypothetical protein [Fictibacillus aquaticus]OYD57695.1 hypothetical protein CGZ90_13610 [Fictibacillus aquaticus]
MNNINFFNNTGQEVKFSFLEKPPASSMTEAFIYVNAANEHMVIKNGERLTKSEYRIGKYRTVYKINMQSKTYHYSREVQSASKGRDFNVDLGVDLYVHDPRQLVEQKAFEIGRLVENYLPHWVETNALRYHIEEANLFHQFIEDFFTVSPLISALDGVGVSVRSPRVMIRQSQHERALDKDDYGKDRGYDQLIAHANRIRHFIEHGDLLTAIMLAESNPPAVKMVEAQIQKEESLQLEMNAHLHRLATDSNVDQIEAREQMEKLQILFPSLKAGSQQAQMRKPASSSDILDDIYESNRIKG